MKRGKKQAFFERFLCNIKGSNFFTLHSTIVSCDILGHTRGILQNSIALLNKIIISCVTFREETQRLYVSAVSINKELVNTET